MSTALVPSARQTPMGYALLAMGLLGFCGLHRFYAGRPISGVIWLLTYGLCGVGQVVDVFFLPRMIEDHNLGRPVW